MPEVWTVQLSPSRSWTGTCSSQRPPSTSVTTELFCRSRTETGLGHKDTRCEPVLLLKKTILLCVKAHKAYQYPQAFQIRSAGPNKVRYHDMSPRAGCPSQRGGGVVICVNIWRSCEFLQSPWANFLQITTSAHFHSTGFAGGFTVSCLQMLPKALSLSQKRMCKLKKQHRFLVP